MKQIATLVIIICCSTLAQAETVPHDQLEQANHIRITDRWYGLSSLSPIVSDYTLDREDKQTVGKAFFSVGGDSIEKKEATTTVSIPAESWREFIEGLASIPLQRGKYKPLITHTDDYPSLEIQFQSPIGTIAFFTQSQGRVPWGLTMNGKSYIINTDEPSKALGSITPYMHHDIVDDLTKRQEYTVKKSATPNKLADGQVTVASVPSHAAFFMDGRQLARTPLTVRKIPCSKPHKLRVTLEGYTDWETILDCSKKPVQEFTVTFHPKQGPAQE